MHTNTHMYIRTAKAATRGTSIFKIEKAILALACTDFQKCICIYTNTHKYMYLYVYSQSGGGGYEHVEN